MKTLFLILFSFSAFGASKTEVNIKSPSFYDVAEYIEYQEFPNQDQAWSRLENGCESFEVPDPEVMGHEVSIGTKGYEKGHYYTENGKITFLFKCKLKT